MSRDTSIEAYHIIQENGLLKKLKWQVYDYVYHNGPCTGKQVDMALSSPTQNSGVFSTRLSELRDMGVMEEVGKIKCHITGHSVILWDVTSSLPVKVRKESKETMAQTILRLQKENEDLRWKIECMESDDD